MEALSVLTEDFFLGLRNVLCISATALGTESGKCLVQWTSGACPVPTDPFVLEGPAFDHESDYSPSHGQSRDTRNHSESEHGIKVVRL